jgi:Cu+-exporting ATPase
MTLEPVTATAEMGEAPELMDMTRRFRVGLVLTLPVFVLEMGSHIPSLGLHHLVPPLISTWVQFALSTPVVLWAGWPFFQRAWASVVHRSLNMFSLIALGTGAAYFYSVFATFAPRMFPAGFRGMGGTVAVYFEAAAVITVLVLLGQVLELRAREQTGGAIRALLKLAPKTAHRLKQGGEDEEIALELVQVGDRLRVKPGDGVPVDGEVLEGMSAADESMVTGESMPAAKQPGDKLIGGTVNGTGSLIMRADKVGADSMLARIVTMVSEAQRSRAPIQRMADGGCRVGLFRPGRTWCGSDCLRCMGGLGSASCTVLRSYCGGLGSHHRLSMRAWSRHPDVDRRGDRQRRWCRRLDQIGRSA